MECKEELLTRQQQKSLHLWFTQCATVLEEAGLDIKDVLKVMTIDIPPTENSFKEIIFKPVMMAMYGIKSTTQLSKKKQIDKIYDVLNYNFAIKLNVSLPRFPSVEDQMLDDNKIN